MTDYFRDALNNQPLRQRVPYICPFSAALVCRQMLLESPLEPATLGLLAVTESRLKRNI